MKHEGCPRRRIPKKVGLHYYILQAFLLQERMQMRSHLEKVRDAAKVRRYTEKWFRFSSDPPAKIRWKNNTPFPDECFSLGDMHVSGTYTPKRR